MKKRFLLVLVAGFLAASAPAAAQYVLSGPFPALSIAQGIDSGATPLLTPLIQASTTFGLIPNEQDFIFEPAELGALKGWKRDRTIGNKWDPAAKEEGGWFLLTNLGNTTTADTFQIGTWGKLGPGNLAFVAAYNRYKDDYLNSPFGNAQGNNLDLNGDGTPDTPTTFIDAFVNERAKVESSNLDLYLAYGFLIGDRSSLGFSVRHIQNDSRPHDDFDSSLEHQTDLSYDVSGNIFNRENQTWLYTRGDNSKFDRKSDQIAAEIKFWPSDDWSLKVRAQYAKIKVDLKSDTLGMSQYTPFSYLFSFCYDRPSWACQYTDANFDGSGNQIDLYSEQQYGINNSDASFDGNEYGISGRLDWYMSGGSAWQFDVGYIKGDYNLKNKNAGQQFNFQDQQFSTDFGDPFGFLSIYDYVNTEANRIFVASEDLKSDRWFASAEYFWQWDQADLAVGLRYNESKSEVNGSGPFQTLQTDDYTTLATLGPPATFDTSVTTYDYRGVFAGFGKVDYKTLELPITAVVHFSDKFALRFGAMHVFYKNEYKASTTETDNFFQYTDTEDGTIVSQFTDPTTSDTMVVQQKDTYDSDYTLYRVGLEYKFNDHVIAELMATESTGSMPINAAVVYGGASQEMVGLDKVVAGVSIRF